MDRISQGEVIPPEKKKKLEEGTKVVVKNKPEKKYEKPRITIPKSTAKMVLYMIIIVMVQLRESKIM